MRTMGACRSRIPSTRLGGWARSRLTWPAVQFEVASEDDRRGVRVRGAASRCFLSSAFQHGDATKTTRPGDQEGSTRQLLGERRLHGRAWRASERRDIARSRDVRGGMTTSKPASGPSVTSAVAARGPSAQALRLPTTIPPELFPGGSAALGEAEARIARRFELREGPCSPRSRRRSAFCATRDAVDGACAAAARATRRADGSVRSSGGQRDRRATRRRYLAAAAAGLEVGRAAPGGRGDRAVQRRRGDGEGPEAKVFLQRELRFLSVGAQGREVRVA